MADSAHPLSRITLFIHLGDIPEQLPKRYLMIEDVVHLKQKITLDQILEN